MEPAQKKVKITDHFRVALKPQNINVQKHTLKKFKKSHDFSKENIEIITISDDDDDDDEDNLNANADNNGLKGNVVVVNNNNRLVLIGGENHIIKEEQETTTAEEGKSKILTDNNNRSTSNNSQNSIISSSSRETKCIKRIPSSPCNKYSAPPGIHPNVVDHDKSLLFDIFCEPHYAWDSFNYDRQQELKYRSRKYLDSKQNDNKMTPFIRARLVNWLVQLQDTFSLYHETLYMAVKMADQYLMRKSVPKQQLQLLYTTSLLISVKFEERLPPVEIEDLLRQCGGVYSRQQVISFEVDILSTLNFNIRYPLSYGFLRRFARCTRPHQKALTLARYILESSLLEYEMIEVLESKIAAAALLLAFEMLHLDEAWTETAEFYTGYKQEELYPLLTQLNDMISRPVDRRISTIREKYGHEIFMSVTRIPPLAKS